MNISLNILLAITGVLIQATPVDSTAEISMGPFLRTIKITHHPEEIMFINRPYNLDLFVDFYPDSVTAVSLFLLRGTTRYQEIHMEKKHNRYSYRLEPGTTPGEAIKYFFVVQLKNFSIFATPLNDTGYIEPVEKIFVDPVQYYHWKKTQNR